MKNRIFALIGILLVISLLVAVQVSAKGSGKAAQKIGKWSIVEKYLNFIHGTDQVRLDQNTAGSPYGGCDPEKDKPYSRVYTRPQFGEPNLLYHRRCSNDLALLAGY
jgi:hypothetical protein